MRFNSCVVREISNIPTVDNLYNFVNQYEPMVDIYEKHSLALARARRFTTTNVCRRGVGGFNRPASCSGPLVELEVNEKKNEDVVSKRGIS